MVFPAFFVSCVCFEYPIQTCSGHCCVFGSFVSVRFLSYLVWFVLLRSSVMSLHSHALSSLCFHVFALGEGWWSGVCVLQLCFIYKLVSFFIFGVSHCSALYWFVSFFFPSYFVHFNFLLFFIVSFRYSTHKLLIVSASRLAVCVAGCCFLFVEVMFFFIPFSIFASSIVLVLYCLSCCFDFLLLITNPADTKLHWPW